MRMMDIGGHLLASALRRPQIDGDRNQQATPAVDLDEGGRHPWSSGGGGGKDVPVALLPDGGCEDAPAPLLLRRREELLAPELSSSSSSCEVEFPASSLPPQIRQQQSRAQPHDGGGAGARSSSSVGADALNLSVLVRPVQVQLCRGDHGFSDLGLGTGTPIAGSELLGSRQEDHVGSQVDAD